MQAIKDFVWNTARNIGLLDFFKNMGAWGSFIIAVLLGALYLLFTTLVVRLIWKIPNVITRFIILFVVLVILGVLAYIGCDAFNIGITKMGGLL